MTKVDDNYKGYFLNTEILANKDERDIWEVTHKLVQGRRLDSSTAWETKEVEVTALDVDIDEAVKQAMMSIAYYLDMVNGDLFNELKKEADDEAIQ